MKVNKKTDKSILNKVEEQIVYHEFGHVFGFFIAKKLDCNLMKIQEIALQGKETHVNLPDEIFKYLHSLSSKQESECLLSKDLNMNKKKVLCYFLFILSGGVFNVLKFKTNPTFYDFEQVFIYDPNKEENEKLIARAGDDFFNKLKGLCYKYYFNWFEYYNIERFKFMAYDFFYILKKYDIFYELTENKKFNESDFTDNTINNDDSQNNAFSLLSIFEKRFNGETITDTKLINKLLDNINKVIPHQNLEQLLIDTNLLIDKYLLDIVIYQKR